MTPDVFDLLLRLLEAPLLQFPRSQLIDHYGPAGEALLASGMLVSDGYHRAGIAADDVDGEVHAIEYSDQHGGLGFHHRDQGWVAVQQVAMQRLQPNLEAVFRQLLGPELLLSPRGIIEREPGMVWHIGTMRLQRLAMTEV